MYALHQHEQGWNQLLGAMKSVGEVKSATPELLVDVLLLGMAMGCNSSVHHAMEGFTKGGDYVVDYSLSEDDLLVDVLHHLIEHHGIQRS